MKPFDLEAAKRGDLLVTRQGEQAKFVAYVPEASGQKLLALVFSVIMSYNDDGRFLNDRESSYDLFMYEAPKSEKWVNLYLNEKNDNWHEFSIWDTEYDADKGAMKSSRLGGKAHRVEV